MTLWAVTLTAHAESPGSWWVQARLDHHDDAVPLRAHGDDDEVLRRLDRKPGRNRAWIDDELRIQHDRGAWSLGMLARSRLELGVDAGTLDLVRHVDRDEPVAATGQRWRVDAHAFGFSGRGLLVGWRFGQALDGASGGWIELQGLQLTRWVERHWTGDVSRADVDGLYTVDLQSWRRDNFQIEPLLPAPAARGHAWLLAGGVQWPISPDVVVSGSVHDVGRLRWRGITEEQAVVSTDNELRDANGQVTLKPLMQGTVRARNASALAPAWAHLRLEVRVTGTGSASVSGRWGGDRQGWRQLSWRQSLSSGYALETRALSPAWPVRRWGLELQSGPGPRATTVHDGDGAPARTADGGDCAAWSIGLATDRLSGQRRSAALLLGWRRCG